MAISSDYISELPKERGWIGDEYVIQYQGFWYREPYLKGLIALQHHFQAEPADILLASYPQSGTTWLKALLVSIISGIENSPLLKASPHDLVPVLEFNNPADLRQISSSTSLFNTHIPYSSLPESIKSSGCRIVYVFRDPKDVFVSNWHFMKKLRQALNIPKEVVSISLEDAFDQFCRGVSPYGPYWNHVLEYWKASLEFPERVFFLRYEALKKEPGYHTKKLSEFLGHPLVDESMVEKVVDLCSFEKLSNLKVNQIGTYATFAFPAKVENNIFFRQGQAGDSKNHLTAAMMDEIDEITKNKFKEFPQLIDDL